MVKAVSGSFHYNQIMFWVFLSKQVKAFHFWLTYIVLVGDKLGMLISQLNTRQVFPRFEPYNNFEFVFYKWKQNKRKQKIQIKI